jgi:membrane-anchored protein YejM (alkaline phosphatase superfamily)
MLYFAMFIQFGRRMILLQVKTTLTPQVSLFLRSVFWMLLLNQFITSFAGQMYHVSYRLIVFVMLGAILGTFKNSSHARANRLQWK